MNLVLKDTEAIAEVLRAVLDKPNLRVLEVRTQATAEVLGHRGVRFDITAEDEDGTRYNIEVQRDSEGAAPKRVRFHQVMMDKEILEPGSKWNDLPETFLIFITEKDVFGGNQPVYHIDQVVREMDSQLYDDQLYRLYVNCSYSGTGGSQAIRDLIHDFTCKNPDHIINPKIAENMKFYKKGEGLPVMSETIRRLFKDELEEAAEQAAEEAAEQATEQERRAGVLNIYRALEEFLPPKKIIERIQKAYPDTDIRKILSEEGIS